MGLWEKLQGLFGGSVLAGERLTQIQNEALAELLVLATIVDGYIDESERAAAVTVLKPLNWRGDVELKTFLANASLRFRNADAESENLGPWCEELAVRLGSAEVRKAAYEVCVTIAGAHDGVSKEESEFLTILGKQLV
jgi:hypothetical protein